MTILARSARRLTLAAALAVIPHLGAAFEPRDGWRVVPTPHDYATLNTRIEAAVEASEIRIVTQASASAGAAQQKITIPGNRVIGLYRNDYARRMLAASIAAGIEAPIRLYVTENADGTATVSYKLPSVVFAPYMDEGGADLAALAAELDQIFQSVTDQAAGN